MAEQGYKPTFCLSCAPHASRLCSWASVATHLLPVANGPHPVLWKIRGNIDLNPGLLSTSPSLNPLQQWFLTFVTQMLLNCNSQKPQSAQLVVKASGSCSPKLLSNPRLRTSGLDCAQRLGGKCIGPFSDLVIIRYDYTLSYSHIHSSCVKKPFVIILIRGLVLPARKVRKSKISNLPLVCRVMFLGYTEVIMATGAHYLLPF